MENSEKWSNFLFWKVIFFSFRSKLLFLTLFKSNFKILTWGFKIYLQTFYFYFISINYLSFLFRIFFIPWLILIFLIFVSTFINEWMKMIELYTRDKMYNQHRRQESNIIYIIIRWLDDRNYYQRLGIETLSGQSLSCLVIRLIGPASSFEALRSSEEIVSK